MEDDEDTISNANKPHNLETGEGNLENEEIKCAEQCESFPELGVSELDVVAGRDETAPLEGGNHVAAEGGADGLLTNHVETGVSELITEKVEETIQQPVVVEEEAVAVEVGGDMNMAVNEEAKRTDEAEVVAGDSDMGHEPPSEPEVLRNAEEEQQLGNKVEVVSNDAEDVQLLSGSQANSTSNKLPPDEQLEVKEFMLSGNMEAAATNVAQVSDLQIIAPGDELLILKEGLEAKEDKVGMDAGDREKLEADGDVKAELADCGTKAMVEGAEDDKEKFEQPSGVVVEEVVPVIIEEVPLSVAKEEEVMTELNTDIANVVEGDQDHQLASDIGYTCAGITDMQSEDKEVNNEEMVISETKTEDVKMTMEVPEDYKLDDPAIVAEDGEESAEQEEFQAGNTEEKAHRGEASEEPQMADCELEKDTATEDVDDGVLYDSKMMSMESRSDADEPGQDTDDSPALQDDEDETMAEEEAGTQDTEMETETDVAESGKASAGKRKRGKLSKSPSITKASGKGSSRKTVGEDVCFICFDGGDLVLCDRRGCPKAYHPSCVNRDEAFFKAKGRWNCGWHLCSICEKNARYMCYTCTFSLCKSCTKDAVILCVRGNKGFCQTCMRTVMLIENNSQGNTDTQIDFDDRSSWEYLFKDYYMELKSKLSLSSEEIAEAKNPWKGSDVLSGSNKQDSSEAQADVNDGGSGSDDSIEKLEAIRPKRRKAPENSDWASKELLEFVAHMKDGDTSFHTQFDVQALLLEYIKRNKLRDPRRKSHIMCDARLESLFGKPRVGHFEMLKLLESHFFVRDDHNDDIQGSVVDTDSQADNDGNAEPLIKSVKDKKRKARRKGDIRGRQSNLDDFAAIDMHNISLIYLRRKLMEDLLEDIETFHDKVVGTFVRIRISGSLQKQDLYRLVQVVATSKAPEPYKIGKKTTDTMVEILNLDKTEVVSIDTISNQEFTEEECKRLRQSIKCGLISRLTVGEILDKAIEIQTARVNDWLESETLRLSHLRDRASDLGRRKELRECVEKLQLLKTPEERRRRLEEIPEIHADPKMDPSYESEENDSETEESKRDAFMRSRGSGFSRRGRGPISPGTDNFAKDSWSGAGRVSNKNWETNTSVSGNIFSGNVTHGSEIVNDNSWSLERDRDTQDSYDIEKPNYAANAESARTTPRSESFSRVSSVTSQASLPASASETAVKINESEKMWHYQDPSGKVQGPFSMVQLRKWNNTGYFPADLRIWRTTQTKDNSIPLANALAGKFPKELPAIDHISSAADSLHSPRVLTGHSGKTSGTSFDTDRERHNVERNPGSHARLSVEKWTGNDGTNLPSPTPKQRNAAWTGEGVLLPSTAIQSPSINGVLPSPTPVLPITATTPVPASVLNSVAQSGTAFSPTPNSQLGTQGGPPANETHAVQMPSLVPAAVQPVQPVIAQNPQAENQAWGSSMQQPGHSQNYGWGTSNTQNSGANFPSSGAVAVPQPDFWRPPTQSSQPNMPSPVAPNSAWGMGPVENSGAGWGMVQPNPNMGWANPAPANTNINWVPPMQVPPSGNPTPGWVAPAGGNMQGPVPGNVSSGWAPSQGWGGQAVQGPFPGNGWAPPSGNPAVPAPLQGPAPGNMSQGWGATSGNQGSWGGDQNHSGSQFPGQRGGRGRDSGFDGGEGQGRRPWNSRQSSFGGGGSRRRRDMPCPYNTNGRCRKGSRCDYLHV